MRVFVPVLLAVTGLVLPSAVVAQSPIPPAFAGWYAGLGGAYGVSTQRGFSGSTDINTDRGFSGGASPDGPSGIAASGYNLQYGALVFGIEGQGRWGQESFARSSTVPIFSTDAAGNFTQGGTFLGSYRFNNDAGIHLAARAGLAINNTLIFAKAGIGAAHISETVSFAGSGDICAATVFVNPLVVCRLRRPLGSASATEDRWMPSFILGVGVEQNFGNWFARVGTEAESIIGLQSSTGARGFLLPGGDAFRGSSSGAEPVWTVRANALIGVRF